MLLNSVMVPTNMYFIRFLVLVIELDLILQHDSTQWLYVNREDVLHKGLSKGYPKAVFKLVSKKSSQHSEWFI